MTKFITNNTPVPEFKPDHYLDSFQGFIDFVDKSTVICIVSDYSQKFFKKNYGRDFVFVRSADKIMGLKDGILVLIGKWYENKDINEILDYAKSHGFIIRSFDV